MFAAGRADTAESARIRSVLLVISFLLLVITSDFINSASDLISSEFTCKELLRRAPSKSAPGPVLANRHRGPY